MEHYNKKISSYISDNKLDMENVIKDYTNYVSTIIRNNASILVTEDIEEIILDVFTALWKNQYKLDFNKSMSAYISGITNNLIKYKLRQKKNVNSNIDEFENQIIDLDNVELSVIKNERETIISKELDLLNSNDKDIFIEYYYSQKSIKEISIMFNMSESKIKSKLFRIRKKLKKALKEKGYKNGNKSRQIIK